MLRHTGAFWCILEISLHVKKKSNVYPKKWPTETLWVNVMRTSKYIILSNRFDSQWWDLQQMFLYEKNLFPFRAPSVVILNEIPKTVLPKSKGNITLLTYNNTHSHCDVPRDDCVEGVFIHQLTWKGRPKKACTALVPTVGVQSWERCNATDGATKPASSACSHWARFLLS